MKKLLIGLLAVGGLLCSAQAVAAQAVNNFEITSFSADYYLSKDDENYAQLRIVEKIEAQFPNFDQNHGIERALPKKYRGQWLGLEVKSISKADGSQWNYTTYGKNDNEVLRIGDKDKFVRGR